MGVLIVWYRCAFCCFGWMVRAQTRGWPLRKNVRGGLLPPGLSLVVYGLARQGGGWCKNQRNTYITARTPTFYKGRQRAVRDLHEGFRERPHPLGSFAGRVLVSQVWVVWYRCTFCLLGWMVRAQTRGWPLRKNVRGWLLPPGLSLVVYGLARPGGGWCKNQRNTYITARTPTFYKGRQRAVRALYEGFRERPLSRGAFAGRVLVSQVGVGARRSHQGRQRAVRALHAGSANDLDRWVRLRDACLCRKCGLFGTGVVFACFAGWSARKREGGLCEKRSAAGCCRQGCRWSFTGLHGRVGDGVKTREIPI